MLPFLEILGRMARTVLLLEDDREECTWPDAARTALAAFGLAAIALVAATG